MGSFFFNLFAVLTTIVFAVICAVLSLLPGRRLMMRALQMYTRTIMAAFEEFCGVDTEVRGLENLPDTGPYIIASKHQSYGDGPFVFSHVRDLSFVADNHIEKFFLLKRILAKIGAVMVDNCGGPEARATMAEVAEQVRREGRKILIYPEGHLSRVGTHHRYRKGVFHLYDDFDCPVVPAATNLGQRWNQNRRKKMPGKAILEFLPPIQPGLDKDVFMARLQDDIETASIALLDLENPGWLDPDDIGRLSENAVARQKRERREAEAERATAVDALTGRGA